MNLSLSLISAPIQAQTNAGIIDGETLINQACKKGFIHGVRFLLENGFDPNLCMPIKDEIVELLIYHGAKVNSHIVSYASIRGSISILKILLKNYHMDNQSSSPIIFAYKMRMLFKKHTFLNSRTC